MKRRVVVTGLGMVTPLGTGVQKNWEAVCAGRSGIKVIEKFDVSLFPTKIAGEVRDFRSEDFMDKQSVRRLDVFVHYALASARMAKEDSGLKINAHNRNRIGSITGSGLGGLSMLEYYHSVLLDQGPRKVSPFFIPGIIANMAPGQIAIEYGAKGPRAHPPEGARRRCHPDCLMVIPRSGAYLSAFAGGKPAGAAVMCRCPRDPDTP